MKTCFKCNVQKELKEFGSNKSKKDGLQTYCKSCRKIYHKSWYINNKELQNLRVRKNNLKKYNEIRQFIDLYLKDKHCVDCGYTDSRALQFDHIRDKKLFNISEAPSLKTSKIKLLNEINKCEIRCANCHSIVTKIRRQNAAGK
jgi:hypothetical protein